MALAAHIASKSGLLTYIKERLGYPVVNIEVTDTQIEHVINETLEKFVEFAEGGQQLRVKTLDIVANTQEYTMPFDTYAVITLFDSSEFNFGSTIFDDADYGPSGEFNPLFNQLSRPDLLTIELSRQMLESINFSMRVNILFDYNTVTRKLYLVENPELGVTAGVVYYQRSDYSDENSLIYDHHWIKLYSTALTKKQWANNLLKYTGSTLPAGLQLNAETILSEAKEDIERLDEELQTVWRLPNDFYIG